MISRGDHPPAEADRDPARHPRPDPLRDQPEVDRLHPEQRLQALPRLERGEGREEARGTAQPTVDDRRGGVQRAGRVRVPDARHPLVARHRCPPAQALGLGVRGRAARSRRARGGGRRDSRAAGVRRRGGRGAGAARGDRAAGAAGQAAGLARAPLRRRPPRARLPRPRQGLPRRGARLSRAVRPPARTWSRGRATRREVEQVLAWCADEGAAAIPYGGGTSVVGGVEPRVGEAYRGAVTIDLGSSRPGARGRLGLAGGADPGGRPRPGARGPAPRARPARCATSPSRSSSRRSAAGSPPGPAATSRRSTRTSTTWSSRCGR